MVVEEPRERYRVHIIEGVPGSGKDTLARRLRNELLADRHPIFTYDEGALLLSWCHFGLPRIDEMRMALMEAFVARVEEAVCRDHQAEFIFNRMHLSFAIMNRTECLGPRYDRLLERLRQLPVEVRLLVLHPHEIDHRSRHVERIAEDFGWAQFLEERLDASPFSTLGALYEAQQLKFVELVQTQGLQYRIEHVLVPIQ